MPPGFLFPVSLARRREGSQAIRSGAWRSEPFTICHAMSHDSVLALHRSKRTVTMSHTLPDQWFRSRWVTSSDNKYRVASQSSIQHILSVQRDHLVNLKRPPNPNSPAFLSCTIQESLPRLRLFPRSDLKHLPSRHVGRLLLDPFFHAEVRRIKSDDNCPRPRPSRSTTSPPCPCLPMERLQNNATAAEGDMLATTSCKASPWHLVPECPPPRARSHSSSRGGIWRAERMRWTALSRGGRTRGYKGIAL